MKRDREHLLQRYLRALDAGDLDAIAQILARAAEDPTLGEMIAEIHQEYAAPSMSPVHRLNGHDPVKEIQPMTPLVMPQTRRNPAYWSLPIAAAITLLLAALILRPNLSMFTLTTDTPQPITSENIAQLTLTDTFGNGQIDSIAVSPDGTTLALATSRGLILHDTADWTAAPRPLTTIPVTQVVYNRAGTQIAGFVDNTLTLWDAETGETLAEWEAALPRYQLLGFSPDDSVIAIVECAQPDDHRFCVAFQVVFWQIDQRTEVNRIVIDRSAVNFQINADWTYLFYVTNQNEVSDLYRIDLGTSAQAVIFTGEFYLNWYFVIGDALYLWQDSDQLMVYDLGTLAPREQVRLERGLLNVLVHPQDASQRLFVDFNNRLSILGQGEPIHIPQLGTLLHQAIRDPQGAWFATLSESGLLNVRDWDTGAILHTFTQYGSDYTVLGIAGDRVVASTSETIGTTRLWDLNTRQEMIIGPIDQTTLAHFIPLTGTILYAQVEADPANAITIHRLDPATSESREVGIQRVNQGWWIGSSVDHPVFFTGVTGALTRLDTDERLRLDADFNFDQRAKVALSPDGRWFVGSVCLERMEFVQGEPYSPNECYQSELRLWDLTTQAPPILLAGNAYRHTLAPVFSADGQTIAGITCQSISRDQTEYGYESTTCVDTLITLWEAESGEVIASFAADEIQGFPALALHRLADSSLLIAAQDGETLAFWQVIDGTGRFLYALNARGNTVTFSEDGTRVMTAGAGVMQVWQVR
ncbi:MAG: hypothetical protein MUF87_15730 [Anaerolineae bacterium]|jgi:WD40 repeat protein|nr:hypothetical protein [Anaerolineae bacterium]